MRYVVRTGDCLVSLAARFGVTTDDLLGLGDNQRLNNDGRNRHILRPGEVIEVPEPPRTTASFSSGGTKRYQVHVPMTDLRIQMRDRYGEKLANKRYELVVAGRTRTGQTDGDGWLEQTVPAREVHAVVRIWTLDEVEFPSEMQLRIGALDPDDEESGIIQRLANLGYGAAEGGAEGCSRALADFQRAEQLEVTGRADSDTRDRLRQRHGS